MLRAQPHSVIPVIEALKTTIDWSAERKMLTKPFWLIADMKDWFFVPQQGKPKERNIEDQSHHKLLELMKDLDKERAFLTDKKVKALKAVVKSSIKLKLP